MIEKLDPEVSTFYTSLDLVNKLNEVIDVLNQTAYPQYSLDGVKESLQTMPEQPAPKVGDLCYFWEDERKRYAFLSILTQIEKSRFLDSDYDMWQYCQLAEINGKPNYPEHIKKWIK